MEPQQVNIMTQTSPENVLVTGGGGFLGKAIVKRLIENGCHVTSFSRNRYRRT